jgi:acetyl esterase/lipase
MSLRLELLRFALRRLFKRPAQKNTDIASLRQRAEAFKRFIPDPPKGTIVTRVDAAGVPGVRVATLNSRNDHHVLFLHGGGYVFGSASHYRDFIWRMAETTRSRVLCIDYRLAPEHPFPAAIDDAVAVYRWLLAEGAEPSRISVIGDSAGGGLTIATLLRLRDEGTALPAAAVALSPWTDLALTGDSVRRFAEADPMLSPQAAATYARWYLAGADPRNPYASPLYGNLVDLPPMLIQVGSDEILLDDGARMAERLRAAGCRVELEVWPRAPHVWQLFARVVPEACRAIERIGDFVNAETLPGRAQACVASSSA